jgi:2-methylisocitrate lyase-like PEP mutase family enzyme
MSHGHSITTRSNFNMSKQQERAHLFAKLHVPKQPLVLFNIWDAGSAKAVEDAGAKAIATGSWSVAAAHGCADGEALSLELALANAKRIVDAVSVPVTIDFEGGYGQSAVQLQSTFAKLIDTGAIGANFEDQVIGGEGLYSVRDQAARITAVRAAAERVSIPFFINARTDIFLKLPADKHHRKNLEEALLRARAYAEAGASGFFAPGLRDVALIKTLCDQSPLPVNIMMMPNALSVKQLAECGVARVSYGPGPYRQMISTLQDATRKALNHA